MATLHDATEEELLTALCDRLLAKGELRTSMFVTPTIRDGKFSLYNIDGEGHARYQIHTTRTYDVMAILRHQDSLKKDAHQVGVVSEADIRED